jgi:hypothetical protein
MDINPLLLLASKLKQVNKDVDFASAVALTRTAKIVQTDVKADIKNKFTLRNTWTERGIRITLAKPEKLESEIYSKDWYLPDQDTGGKRQKTGGIFMPGEDFYRVTKLDSKRVVPKKFRGSKIQGQKFNGNKAFNGRFKSGAKFVGVRREAGTYDPEKERNFDVLYIIVEDSVDIRGRKFFQDVASNAYNKHFQDEYDKAWDQYVSGASA